MKLQFADSQGATSEIAAQDVGSPRFGNVGAGETHKTFRIFGLQGRATGVIAEHGKHPTVPRQQDSGCDAVKSLVGEELSVGSPVVVGVLVEIEQRRVRSRASSHDSGCGERASQESTPGIRDA